MSMYLSELQNKEVISIASGLNLGHIIDVEIDNSGNIVCFVVEDRKIFRKGIANMNEFTFKYSDIEKIGKDVVLVRV